MERILHSKELLGSRDQYFVVADGELWDVCSHDESRAHIQQLNNKVLGREGL